MKTFISDMLRRGVITSNSTRNYLKRGLAALFFTFTITQVCAEFNVDWVQRIQTTPERRASAFLGSTQLPDGSIATVGTYSGNWIIETYAALINSDGTTRWQVVLDDPLKQQYAVHTVFGPRQVSIVADPDGNPTIAYDCGAPNSRTCLVKFRKTDGAVVWRNSPAPGIEGECVIAGAGSYGFYRFCPNVGGVRMFLWDGTVAWTAAETGYGKLLLPLTSGNFVRGYYDSYFLSGTMKVLSGQTGQVLYEIPVPGEIYDSYALDDGGFLLQTLRNPGFLPFRSTLDRYDGAGTLMWRHERADPALNNMSYSGQPLTVVGDSVIRYTPSSAGDIRISTGLDGAFRWESAAAFNSELLNIDNRLYVKSYGGLGELLSPINYVDGSSLGTSLQIDGYRFSNSPISNGLLVVRQGNDTAGSYVLERYSAQIVRQWQSALLTTAPQITARVPTTSSIFDPQPNLYLGSGCKQLHRAVADEWGARIFQKSPIFGASDNLMFRFSATTGVEFSRSNPGSCERAIVSSGVVYSFTSSGELQKATDVGTPIWTATPFSTYDFKGHTLMPLRNGAIAVAASGNFRSMELAWTYSPAGVQLSGPTTLPERPLRLIPSLQGSYFAIYASNQISFVDDSGALVWTLPTIADNSCFGTSVREVIPAANGDLVVVFIDCVARISPAGAARWKTRLIAQYPQTFRPVTAIETSDGTFVVAGCIGNESAVRAFGADGTTKWTRTDDVFVDSAECAEKLAVTPDGKIWLVVSSGSTCSRSVLIRLGADGTLEYADSRAFSAPLVRVSELEVLPDASLLALGDGYDEVDRRRVASIRKISTGRNKCVLDVTGDGTVDVQSDALPLLRFMFGFNSLRTGFPPTQATCSFGDSIQIARAKSAVGISPFRTQPSIAADIDGDGAANPLVDGLLLIRALLGLRGSALTNAISFQASATRTTATDIMTYLSSCGVSPSQ